MRCQGRACMLRRRWPATLLLLLSLLLCQTAPACRAQLLGEDFSTASAARHDHADAAARARFLPAHRASSGHSLSSWADEQGLGQPGRQLLQEHTDSNAVRAGKTGNKKRQPAKALVDALETVSPWHCTWATAAAGALASMCCTSEEQQPCL